MTEIPDELFADLASRARDRYGFVIEPRKFAVTGHCASCPAAGRAGHRGRGTAGAPGPGTPA